MFVKLIKMIP